MLEVAVEDLRGGQVAREGGASRLELCVALELGGLTPSVGLIEQVVAQAGLPVHVLVRPRAGDFVYDHEEVALISRDAMKALAAGAQGLVLGAGARNGLDCAVLAQWVEQARREAAGRPVSLTLHRVFDLLDDPFEGLEQAISLGFDRILTSGGQPHAGDGAALFEALNARAAGRIVLMAGGGLSAEAIPVLKRSGVGEFHASCRSVAREEAEAARDPRLVSLGFAAGPIPTTDLARVQGFAQAAGAGVV